MKKPKQRFGSYFLEAIELRREDVPSFKKYPFSLPVVRDLHSLTLDPKLTIFVGENGAGKSTLLEAIAVAWGFNAEGGSRNFSFSTRSSHSALADHLRLKRGVAKPSDGYFLRAESFFNVASEIERLDEEGGFGRPIISSYGGISLHEQSHGESFFALFKNRLGGDGLYLLDEPEAALSPMRQMAMLSRMHQLIVGGSQFIMATHSPILMAYPGALILLCSEDGVRQVAYEETEHYFVTREFLNNTEGMLRHLLGNDDDEGRSGSDAA